MRFEALKGRERTFVLPDRPPRPHPEAQLDSDLTQRVIKTHEKNTTLTKISAAT